MPPLTSLKNLLHFNSGVRSCSKPSDDDVSLPSATAAAAPHRRSARSLLRQVRAAGRRTSSLPDLSYLQVPTSLCSDSEGAGEGLAEATGNLNLTYNT